MRRFFLQFSHLAILVALAVPAAAQVVSTVPTPQRVFVVTDANRLYRIDFDGGMPIGPLNSAADADQRTALRDLVVRDLDLADRPDRIDLLLFDWISPTVADILRYAWNAGVWEGFSVVRGPFAQPNGLSLGGGGSLYFFDNPTGSPSRVWVLPADHSELPQGDGFAAAAVPIDLSSPCDVMADTAVVTFQGPGLSFGDLVVLCQEPPLVLRYPKGKPCQDPAACTSSERHQLFALPATEHPTSLLFSPAGNLLMSSYDDVNNASRILRFFVDNGSLDVAPFVGGLPPGEARMVGGIQDRPDGKLASFLVYANRGDMSVARYVPAAGGGVLDPDPPTPNPVPLGNEGPVGVGVGTSRAAPTRAGDGSRTQPRESLLATFDKVTLAGLTESRLFVFFDPRPPLLLDPPNAKPLYLCDPQVANSFECQATVNDFFVDLGLPNVIPPRVRPLSVKSASRGIPGASHPFVLFDLSSTAAFEKTVKIQALEELVLGDDIYHCQEAAELGAVAELPLFFHGADLDDPPVVDGFDFFAVPSGCGSNFGRTFAFSSFLVGRYDVADVPLAGQPFAAALPAVQSLRFALDVTTSAASGGLRSFIGLLVGGQLFRLASEAEQAIFGQDPAAGVDRMESLIQMVKDNPGAFNNLERNISGELQVRATSVIFLLCAGTNCSDAYDTHAEDIGQLFVDGFETGDPSAWSASTP